MEEKSNRQIPSVDFMCAGAAANVKELRESRCCEDAMFAGGIPVLAGFRVVG